MMYTYQHDGETYSVQLEKQGDGAYRATISGGGTVRTYALDAAPLADGWLLTLDGRRLVTWTAAQGSERFVHAGGQTFTLSVPEARGGRRQQAGGGDLTAQMPGQVINVLVAEGEAVESGQTLVILEAMKMEIRVAAPGGGTVKRLHVARGDMVDRGQKLAEIE